MTQKSLRASSSQADHHGVRLYVTCRLGAMRNTLQVDVGFGEDLQRSTPRKGLVAVEGRRSALVLRSRETFEEMLLHLFQSRKAFGHHELASEQSGCP